MMLVYWRMRIYQGMRVYRMMRICRSDEWKILQVKEKEGIIRQIETGSEVKRKWINQDLM